MSVKSQGQVAGDSTIFQRSCATRFARSPKGKVTHFSVTASPVSQSPRQPSRRLTTMGLLSNIVGFSLFGLAARIGQLGIQKRNPFESTSNDPLIVSSLLTRPTRNLDRPRRARYRHGCIRWARLFRAPVGQTCSCAAGREEG